MKGGAAKAVVFDFGGVIFNWRPVELIQSLWPQHAADAHEARRLASEVFQSFVPGGDWAEFDRGTLPAEEVGRRIAGRIGLPEEDLHRLMAAIPAHLVPLPETVQWLERLSAQGVPLHFLSNMPRPYADHLQSRHGFLKCFRSGVFSCEVGHIKPEPAAFAAASRRVGLPPGECVFIDDHPANVETARQLGWHAVLFEGADRCEQLLLDQGLLAP